MLANSNTSLTTSKKPSINSRHLYKRGALCIAVAMSLSISACSDNDDEVTTPVAPVDSSAPMGRFAVAMNDGQSAGSVAIFAPDFDTLDRTFTTGANQGVTVDTDGTLYQNADIAGDAGVRVINRISDRVDMDSFGASDRRIGTSSGKGLFTLPGTGLLASCDVTDDQADLKMFSVTASAQAQALSSINLPASCWDGAYSATDDRLYLALTDGRLAIIDEVSQLDFSEDGVEFGDEVLDRIISIAGSDGVQTSVNFHGVAVESGIVLVSDVGSADSPTDGALYAFNDDGSINGSINLSPIAGAATLLGNPVDVLLVNGDAIVAEKSNDAILVFKGVVNLSGNVTPNYQLAFTKPESLVVLNGEATVADASDIVAGDQVSTLLISQNPGPQQDDGSGATNDNVGRIALIDAPSVAGVMDTGQDVSLASITGVPGQQSFLTLENIQLDATGNGYAVFDITDGNAVSDRGVLVINGLSGRGDKDSDVINTDRMIFGSDVGLTSPKGIEIAGKQGALIIADLGNDSVPPSLVVLSVNADGNSMPMFSVSDTGSAAIWDMDYDAMNDRLYAAGTGGEVLVYDDFFAAGASATPTRSFSAADAGVVSNFHGIAHDELTDRLMVTDVGDAASATDGSFYLIENASTATGIVAPVATIAGPQSMLGNPVDIAFDGSGVYIAEKSNDQVLIYRNVMSLQGQMDKAADESIVIVKPESVTLQRQ